MFGSVPLSMVAADLPGNRVNERDGLRHPDRCAWRRELLFFMVRAFATCGSCGARRSSLPHGGVAFVIAESEDFLQRDADVRQILLDVSAPVIFLAKMHLAAQVVREPARALLQPQFDLLEDLRIRLDRLFGLRRVGNPNRCDMNQDRHWRDRQCSLRLVQAIGAPVRLDDSLGDGATRLLVEQRHPVRKTQQTNGLVLLRYEVFGGTPFIRFRSCAYGRSCRLQSPASPRRP